MSDRKHNNYMLCVIFSPASILLPLHCELNSRNDIYIIAEVSNNATVDLYQLLIGNVKKITSTAKAGKTSHKHEVKTSKKRSILCIETG